MKKNHWTLTVVAGAIGAASLTAAPAHAHISTKGALQSRGGDQKQSPCDGAKGDGMVYTFAPGATISLAVNEDVPHPSYFRVAFDNDGEDFVEPASIDPIDKSRGCPINKDDQCGKSDYCSTAGAAKGAIVLWDNLDPHLAAAAKGGTWNIKLPDVECENCTLQVLQIMEDDLAHGAYCPQGSCAASGASLEDIYHRCIDIKLVKGATNGPGATTAAPMNMGMECPSAAPSGAAGSGGAAAAGGGGAAPAAGSGGAATSGSAGASAAAGAAAGSAGSPSTAGSTAATPSAGSAGTATAGKPAVGVGTGAAGRGAVTSTAGTGTIMSPATGAGALATDAPTPAPAGDSGCAVVAAPRSGVPSGMFTGTTLIALALFGARRRAKSRAGKRERAS